MSINNSGSRVFATCWSFPCCAYHNMEDTKPQPKYSISGAPQCWCITVHFRDAEKCKARLTALASSPQTVCQHLLFQPRNRNKIMSARKKKFSSRPYQVKAGNVTAMTQMAALWGNRSMITTGTTLLSAVLQIGRSLVRFQMVSLEFFIDIILPIALWPWVDLASNRNEYQEYFLGVKVAGA